MSIVIGADAAGLRLKEVVKDFLEKENFHVVDVTAEGQDFVDVTLAVAAEVNKEEQNLGIVMMLMVLVHLWLQQRSKEGCRRSI